MRFLLTLRADGSPDRDIAVTADAQVAVGEVAASLNGAPGTNDVTLFLERSGRWEEVDPRGAMAASPVGSGAVIKVAPSKLVGSASSQSLRIVAGPDAGKRIPLRRGVNTLGRDGTCDIVLNDPMASRHHAQVLVQDDVEIVDDSSVNGLISGGQMVARLSLSSGDEVTVGETTMRLEQAEAEASGRYLPPGTVEFNRSPRVVPAFPGEEFEAPQPPSPARPQPIPWIAAAMPLIMAPLLYIASNGRWQSLLFVLLSPIMAFGSWTQNRAAAKRQFREEKQQFEDDLAGLVATLRQSQDRERAVRLLEHPSISDVVDAAAGLEPLLWTRRSEHEEFLDIRLGLGRQACRTTVQRQNSGKAPWALVQQVEASVVPFETIDSVPVVCALSESGALGVSGPLSTREGVSAGLIAQLVGLHSPADLSIAALVSTAGADRWNWIKWLPHSSAENHPLSASLASTPGEVGGVVTDIAGLLEMRSGGDGVTGPVLVVLVENEAQFERSALVDLAERGPEHGIHFIWHAEETRMLPAVCRTFLELEPASFGAATGKVREHERVVPVVVETVDQPTAEWLGRQLSPVVDDSLHIESESDIPTRVSMLTEMGVEIATTPSFIIERWQESHSLRREGVPSVPQRRANSLRAMVGRTNHDPLYLDLRAHGPHALVGGTTGAGKSEFLQTWILGMAAGHSPQRVTFLFVDYKGGAAFADCVSLPHTVGLVTDLSPRLVQRALRSLNAELRYREHILNRKRAKDLLELEARNDPETPPSLVIVVDEFAALIQEVPEFVDGVVNIAQRGRSLGLHLILATQRPAGVIKGNLRANTNLRVALRMADSDDSTDVIGTTQAATFDPSIPGRAIAKTGPGRLSLFQAAYVGGITLGEEGPADVEIHDLDFGIGTAWEVGGGGAAASEIEADTPTDIRRLVETIVNAADQAGVEEPRKPWLPELAGVYDLSGLPTQRTDEELTFGVMDKPDEQSQGTVSFRPDSDGSMVIFGTGAAGKSTALRSLAVAAGLTARGGRCEVYGIDFGSRSLSMLEALPHVGSIIAGDDIERTVRLFRRLRAIVEDRAEEFSRVNSSTIVEYRKLAEKPDEPRILLMVDGFSAFRSAYEVGPNSWLLETLQNLAVDGRPLGIHVILTADRPGAVPAALASVIQSRLVLRLASVDDVLMAPGVPKDGLGDDTPAGRGFLAGEEVQVAILGGETNAIAQSLAIDQLARAMRRVDVPEAEVVERLPELVELSGLPVGSSDAPVFALGDDDLGPFPLRPRGIFLVTGPSGSGRSTAVATIVAALQRSGRAKRTAYLGHGRSLLSDPQRWSMSGRGASEVAEIASDLAVQIRSEDTGSVPDLVVLEGVGEFVNGEADFALVELLKACRTAGVFVLAEAESSDIAGSWPLLQEVRSSRQGIVLQPDQMDGDMLFKVTFPRLNRRDFPPGRGMHVANGKATKIQVAFVDGSAP